MSGETSKAMKGIGEKRISLSPAQKRKYDENFAAIEDMEERKQIVLARCRAEKEARKRR